MTDKRLRAAMLAVCGGIAGLVLLAGSHAANADELSQLRANSALLQQRIDAINRLQAHAADGQGAAATGGAFPRSLLIPGTDTSISIGGSISAGAGWAEGRPAIGR